MHPITNAKLRLNLTGEKQYVFKNRLEIYSCRLENGELKENDRRPKITPPHNKPKLLFSYNKD